MHVVVCRPERPQSQRDRFELEADALDELGVEPRWLDMEAVVDGRLDEVLDTWVQGRGPTLLRSWMLREEAYTYLYDALSDRGYDLVVDPAAYTAAHYLPQYLEAIEPWTPPTRWIEGADLDEAWTLARELGPGPYLLKDHVKSAKDDPSCGIVPAGASKAEFVRICEAFIDHRGDAFEGGLVVRAMLPLVPVDGGDGEPCFDEYRLVFWEGDLAAAAPYFDVDGDRTDFSAFAFLGRRIASPFFTADVARLTSGDWIVLEIGDGGVSALPPRMDPRELYAAILGTSRIGGSHVRV